MHDDKDAVDEIDEALPADPMPIAAVPRVGYKKPPEKNRFPKGKSGNPNGRPRGAKGQRQIAEKVLLEKHTFVENGRTGRRKMLDWIVRTLRNRAFEGDSKAHNEIEKLLAEFGPQEQKNRADCLMVPGRLSPEEWNSLFAPKSNPNLQGED